MHQATSAMGQKKSGQEENVITYMLYLTVKWRAVIILPCLSVEFPASRDKDVNRKNIRRCRKFLLLTVTAIHTFITIRLHQLHKT